MLITSEAFRALWIYAVVLVAILVCAVLLRIRRG